MRLLERHEERDLARMDSRAFKFQVSEKVSCVISISAVSNAHGIPNKPSDDQIKRIFNSELRLLLTNGELDGREIPCVTYFNFAAYTLPKWQKCTIVISVASMDDDSIISRIPKRDELLAVIQAVTDAINDHH